MVLLFNNGENIVGTFRYLCFSFFFKYVVIEPLTTSFRWRIYLIRLQTTTQINCSQYNIHIFCHLFLSPSLSFWIVCFFPICFFLVFFWNVWRVYTVTESNQLLSPVQTECGLTNRKYYHVEFCWHAWKNLFVPRFFPLSHSLTLSILFHNTHAVLVLFCVHSHHKTMCIL